MLRGGGLFAFSMTECNQTTFLFEAHFSRQVGADFDGARMTTDGGALLLRVVACFTDARDPERIAHELPEMLAQSI